MENGQIRNEERKLTSKENIQYIKRIENEKDEKKKKIVKGVGKLLVLKKKKNRKLLVISVFQRSKSSRQ